MNRPLRVLTVARWYPSHDGPGRGTFVADLVRATVAGGVQARVVSFDRVLVRGRLDAREAILSGARAAFERVATPEALFAVPLRRGAPGVPVARIPVVRRPGTGDVAALVEDYTAALRPFFGRLVAEWRPDIIHAHTGLPDGIVSAGVGRAFGIPVIVSEHASTIESDLSDPEARARYRTLLSPGVRLLAVSPTLARRLADLLGVATDPIEVVPNPIDDASFPLADPGGRDPDELLWVGALGEHKGIGVLLRAFSRLRSARPALRLRLIGGERNDGDIARWQALAVDLGIGGSVVFEGWLDRASVARAMARAGVLVHPSPSETFGVVAAEAILSGLPVATRRSGGVPWIVELSGGFGAVASDDGETSFVAAIETVLDRRLPVAAGEARARLVNTVGEAVVAATTIAGYRQLVEAGPVRPADAADPATSPAPVRPRTAVMPKIVVATGREGAVRLVAGLPPEVRQGLLLVVPPAADGAAADEHGAPSGVRIVDAAPARYERPPSGRSPMSRLKRAAWRPPMTAEEELGAAVRRAAAGIRRDREACEVIALDAPAAVIVAELDPRHISLAPGSLRWLADRSESRPPT